MTLKRIPYLLLVVLFGLNTILLGTDISTPNVFSEDFRNSLHYEANPNLLIGEFQVPTISYQAPQASLATNFDDILISESTSPANFTQQEPDVAALTSGRFAAVWEDNRLGPKAVYLQIFNSALNAIGGNSSLIFGESYNLSNPRIAPDTLGNFYVVWREEIHGNLQAARFDSTAAVLTDVFYVSDTIMLSYSGEFAAACLADGKLVVTWENHTLDDDIAYRIFNTDGTPSTGLLNANTSTTDHQWSPAIVGSNDNNFAIVWEDSRSGKADIFFRRFNSLGTPYTSDFSISDESARDSARYMPEIVFSPTDGYIAAWIDSRDGKNIYLQKLTAAGVANGSNELVSDNSTNDANWEIDLSVNGLGYLNAAWTVYGNYNTIMMQRYSNGVVKNGSVIAVSNGTEKLRFTPAIASNKINVNFVIWTDLIDGSIDIFGYGINNSGTELAAEFTLNDDNEGAPSIEPAVTTLSRYEWDIVFTDMRRDAGDIMLQRVYVGGELVDGNRRINSDPAGGNQSQPAISSANETLCISWTDIRSNGVNGQNIFCRFSKPHYDLTDEIVVNDDFAGSAAHYNSANAMNSAGISLIAWTDTRQSNPKIFGQLFDGNFDAIGDNFLIGSTAPAGIGEKAQVSVASDGSFIVSYLNRLVSGGAAVEVKKVTTDGTVADMFSFQSDQTGYTIDGFDAGVNSTDAIYIVWHAFSAAGPDLFLTVFNDGGTVMATTQSIIDNSSAAPGIATMTVDSDNYLLIAWLDNRTGSPTPFRQIYESTLAPIQSNTPTYTSTGPYMQTPIGAGSRGRGIFIWADGRASGLNIYAAQELYAPTDADDDISIPTMFNLAQNRPNPFNPSTVIEFSLPQTSHVTLEVMNILGQRIRLLTDESYPAGTHEIIWDGHDESGERSASGIYFYRISNDSFTSTRKMVLVK
ncbi:MAG: T9SS type A sorting domain-containing protein [candidate division Zixibacteria bacterium]|nr:T9SS type A sorting domain-containing protein [candidate division Zixibacteria bacterium]